MNFTNMLRIAAIGAILAVSSAAANASTGTAQTHHCKTQDGTMDMKLTKKKCLAAKGTWAKDDAAPAASAAPAAATTATPAAPAAPAASAPAPK